MLWVGSSYLGWYPEDLFNCLLICGSITWEYNCSSMEAVNRIYEIKGRKHTSPLAICVSDVSDIERFAVTEHLPQGLLESLLPGPVTVVLRRGLLPNFFSFYF